MKGVLVGFKREILQITNPYNLICRDFVIPEESLSCFMWRRFQRDKLYVQELLYPVFVIPEESLSCFMFRRFQRDKLYV